MPLPNGLLPAYVFVLTVGLAVIVTARAHHRTRTTNSTFTRALKDAFTEAAALYVVGAVAVWILSGTHSVLSLVVTMFVPAIVAFILLMGLPLLVGRWFVARYADLDGETALRLTTYGWLLTMALVFAVFMAPGGFTGGHIFAIEGQQTCLAGFCGIIIPFAVLVAIELVIALVGPGLVGVILYSTMSDPPNRGVKS
jgi:hypothetical protein